MVIASLPDKSAAPQHKKRHGQHHKSTKHYAKTYWPYLPMLLIIGFGFVLNSLWSAHSSVLSYATSVSITDLLQETNIQRSQNGKDALSLNSLLNQAAQEKANDMAARDYWSHATPEGRQPWQFVSAAGYTYTYAGENLAYGFATSADAVAGWMNSPSHRDNVLNVNYKDVGFGFANAANYQGTGEETIIVAMYAAPPKAAAAAPTASPAKPAPVTVAKPAEPAPAPAATPAPAAQPTTAATPAVPSVPASQAKEKTTAPQNAGGNSQSLASQKVSRIDVLAAGNAEWAALVMSALASLAAISFIYRHGKMWRRFLAEGEHFIIRHPLLDTAIVALAVASVLLTRTSGIIH